MTSEAPAPEFCVGERVTDREPGESPSMRVLGYSPHPSGEHVIEALDATVADVQPPAFDDPDDRVVRVVYEGDLTHNYGERWETALDAAREGGTPWLVWLDEFDSAWGTSARVYTFPQGRLEPKAEETEGGDDGDE